MLSYISPVHPLCLLIQLFTVILMTYFFSLFIFKLCSFLLLSIWPVDCTLNLYAICCNIYSLFALKLCSFLLLNIRPVDCLLWTCMLYAVTYIGSLLWNCTAFCCNTYGLFTICLPWTCMAICCSIYIQYWCIDGKYRIYVTRLRNGGKDEL